MTSFGLDELTRDECDALLHTHHFGRMGVSTGEHPAILPVLYAMFEGDVLLRTAPGEKLIAAVMNAEVVFEIDGVDLANHTGWSVNVVGTAERITKPDAIERARALAIEPWAGEWRDEFVRINATHVTGRAIRRYEGPHADATVSSQH
jgi:nitroimidazol reductase NimA-like FMN-containing flavoprotein (pyridoxamine 5'-phosphate oxidase superfamily)